MSTDPGRQARGGNGTLSPSPKASPRSRKAATKAGKKTETEHAPFLEKVVLSALKPAPENDLIYRPFTGVDPDDIRLVDSIRDHGLKEPLQITKDDFVLSGHRRLKAIVCLLNMGKISITHVPCYRLPVVYEGLSKSERLSLLKEHNQQREKTHDEVMREMLVGDPGSGDAYEELKEKRLEATRPTVRAFEIIGTRNRSRISKAKWPLLERVQEIVEDLRDFWPISVRQIHYNLLNGPPLIHASKADSLYRNTKRCYDKGAVDIAGRGRIEGFIPWEAIEDETRPFEGNFAFENAGEYVEHQLNRFMKGYWRDLMQSQSKHIEIVCEKNTVRGIISPIAREFTLPMLSGRGYCSLDPRKNMLERFRRSGKGSLLVLFLADFDPEGIDIGNSFAKSMRDDFGVENIEPVRVGLTQEHVHEFNLPTNFDAKKSSSRYKKFARQYGDSVHELEAVSAEDLQRILTEAINGVIDVDAFNHEVDREREDAEFLQRQRDIGRRALMAAAQEGGN